MYTSEGVYPNPLTPAAPYPKVLLAIMVSPPPIPPKRLPPFFTNAHKPRAVPAIPTIYSYRVASSIQFSNELLHLYIYM